MTTPYCIHVLVSGYELYVHSYRGVGMIFFMGGGGGPNSKFFGASRQKSEFQKLFASRTQNFEQLVNLF